MDGVHARQLEIMHERRDNLLAKRRRRAEKASADVDGAVGASIGVADVEERSILAGASRDLGTA